MKRILVDSNVLLDFLDPTAEAHPRSTAALRERGGRDVFVINPLIYAEVSVNYPRQSVLDADLPPRFLGREDLPWEAAFQAAKAFVAYRRRGGSKTSPLPDFYIGAHAETAGYRLLTRDAARYRTYFPTVELITP
ncbi:MAG: type II toxin-antitoxin system VapC family toxin [Longimicrobiaceae bacterium]